MNRRTFIHQTTKAAAILPFVSVPKIFKEERMGIVVHSYGIRWNSKIESTKYPGFSDAIELIEHCHAIGAGGVQVGVGNWSADFAKKVRARREKLGLYLEGSIGLPKSPEGVSTFEQEVINAKEAGARILRTVCLGGRRYETFHSADEFETFRKNSIKSLQIAEPVVRKHQMKLAVENHKDWRAPELADVIKNLSSESVGVTVDFGNSISLIEDPMEVVQTLAPYAFSTHVKDMGVDEYQDGFLLSEVPLGTGILDLAKMYRICREHNPTVTFNLEMITRDPLKIPCLTETFWSTFPDVSPMELARTLQMVKQKRDTDGLPEVSQLNNEEKLAVEEQNILESLRYSKQLTVDN
jgi:sugar phosphate isomerase/epimerase